MVYPIVTQSSSPSLLRIAAPSILMLAVILASAPIQADMQVTQIPIILAEPGTVRLGFGYRSGVSPYKDIDNVASMKNDNSSDLVPLYHYGERSAKDP